VDTQKAEQAAEWLARAQQEPAYAWHEWAVTGVALLPLGRRFVAPRLSESLVHAAATSSDPDAVTARLVQLDGPVIFDGRMMGGTFYPLMRPLFGRVWQHQDAAPLLAEGTYLGVPRFDRLTPPGTYWAVPPRAVGDLCEPAAVDALITRACTTAREAER
jgi:hypothetical protein